MQIVVEGERNSVNNSCFDANTNILSLTCISLPFNISLLEKMRVRVQRFRCSSLCLITLKIGNIERRKETGG
jgi:hypothetical protein